jgi:hypothetical protein
MINKVGMDKIKDILNKAFDKIGMSPEDKITVLGIIDKYMKKIPTSPMSK